MSAATLILDELRGARDLTANEIREQLVFKGIKMPLGTTRCALSELRRRGHAEWRKKKGERRILWTIYETPLLQPQEPSRARVAPHNRSQKPYRKKVWYNTGLRPDLAPLLAEIEEDFWTLHVKMDKLRGLLES